MDVEGDLQKTGRVVSICSWKRSRGLRLTFRHIGNSDLRILQVGR